VSDVVTAARRPHATSDLAMAQAQQTANF